MKKSDVKIGSNYLAKVSDKVVSVRIDGENRLGGWDATNLATGKKVRIKSAQRLRGPAKSKAKDGESKQAKPEEQTGSAPRSELTLEEAEKLKAARAKKQARKDGDAKPKRTSALDAAAEILRKSGEPMTCKAMIDAMAEQSLWTSPGGKTPSATLYSAILREVTKKGDVARFRKVDRGQFAFAGKEV